MPTPLILRPTADTSEANTETKSKRVLFAEDGWWYWPFKPREPVSVSG